MAEFNLHKAEKLCSQTAIDRLFSEGQQAKAYPLRAVYRLKKAESGAPAQFLISIPKKKIRRAVGRVLLRRRVREAYRLNRCLLYPSLISADMQADIAFIYLSNTPKNYHSIEKRVRSILQTIAQSVTSTDTPPSEK